jgi:hypothetical protein
VVVADSDLNLAPHQRAGRDYPGTWQDFERWFSDDEACAAYLERLRWPKGFGVSGICVAAGVVVAGGLRVITAGTNGANIGGGMVMMFGPITLIMLAAGGAFLVSAIHRDADGSTTTH